LAGRVHGAVGARSGRGQHGRDAPHVRAHPAGPEAQKIDEFGGSLAADTVDFGGGDTGRLENPQRGLDGNGKGVVTVKPAGLRGVVHRRNRHVPVGMGGRGSESRRHGL
jgi:hypothetical protein